MSLFDVLRYPISDRPTAAELTALPIDLYNKWLAETEWCKPGYRNSPKLIGVWYSTPAMELFESDRNEITLLREMIKEYDEPI